MEPARDPKVPISLIKNPNFARACADHDMAQVFKMAQKYAGLSKLAISRMTSIKPDNVALIMKGDRMVQDFDVYVRISDGLGIPGPMLGLAERPWEGAAREESRPELLAGTGDAQESSETMERRQFLAGGAGLAAGAYLSALVDGEPLAMNKQLAAGKRSAARVAYFENIAERLGNEVIRVPSPTLLESSLVAFRDARLFAMECSREEDRRRVVMSNSKLATVIGLILFDSNQFSAAEQWYRTARSAAQDVGDQYLSDIALASQTYMATYSPEPNGVLSLLVPRLESRPPDTAAIAWQWAFCGKAYALLGDRSRAEHAFDRSEHALNGAPSETVRPGIFSFLPEKLAMYRAQAYVSLDLQDRAMEEANQALSLYDLQETTEPSLARFELATALLRAGDVDEACKEATNAVAGPSVFMNITLRKSADRFTKELPNTKSSAIGEWKETLWAATA